MELLEKMIVENYKYILIILIFILYTYRFLIKRLQVKNEKLVIEEFYKNDTVKSVHLKDSKIYIDKYEKPNYIPFKSKINLKEKEPELPVIHRKSPDS